MEETVVATHLLDRGTSQVTIEGREEKICLEDGKNEITVKKISSKYLNTNINVN